MLAVEISKDAVLVSQHHAFSLSVVAPPTGARLLPIDLRAGLHFLASTQIIENFSEALGSQVLIVIVIDLRHRRIDASAEALDLDPGELAVFGDVTLLADALAAHFLQIVGAAQPARCRAAELHVEFSDRL